MGGAEADRSLVGRTVGNFRIEQRIGSGGMGEVYRLLHTRLPNTVAALKVLHQKSAGAPYVKERFVQEALVAAAVGNHRVVRPIDIGRFDDGAPYIIFELAHGRTLAQELADSGPLPVVAACRIAHRVADTMTLVHARGIVHRDLKPSNLILDGELANPRVKILDFGVARPPADLRLAHTVEHAIVGSPGFMSPEAATGDMITAHSDVFSLGATLFRSLASEVPFPTTRGGALFVDEAPMIASKRPPDLDPVPPSLEALVGRMLAKDPLQRPTMVEVRDVIGTIVEVPPELPDSTPPIAPALASVDDVVASTITIANSGPAIDLAAVRAQLEELCDAKLATASVVSVRRSRWVSIGALIALAAVAGIVIAMRSSRESELPPFAKAVPQQITFSGLARLPAISPDNRQLAYVQPSHGGVEVVIQDLKSGHAHVIARESGELGTCAGRATAGNYLSTARSAIPSRGPHSPAAWGGATRCFHLMTVR